MLKKKLFLLALASGEYKRKSFIISAFSVVHEEPAAWQKNPYPYRIVQTPTSLFFINPEQNNELCPIDDAVAGQPLFTMKEQLSLTAGEVPNLKEDITTTYGKVLFNYIVLINSFGTKIDYINTRVKPSDLEELILPLFKDYPAEGTDKDPNVIYVEDYLKYCDSMFYLTGFTQLCVPAATKKTMTAAPGIEKLKARLLEENKDRLHDPEVIANIDAELVKYDREYMKGDLGEGFLIGGESYTKIRKKLFSMHGAETGLKETVDVELIQNSLSQGWDINAFPAMNNSLRAGSFNRGAETVKGGEAFKWLQRASSNINVTIDDCGSTLGNIIDVTENNLDWIVGFSVITKSGPILIEDKEAAKLYIGKQVTVRSPMFCKVEKTDFCHVCVGRNLSSNPTGLSVAITQYGSTMLYIMMKLIHGKVLAVAKMDYKEAIF